ncbi:ATP-binding protein [Caulobacter sp.]|uniref:ATP-binding protein n=1 Tax=Caulobacter sp. TaxID=78 RepID=UPI003BA8ABCA
MTRTASRPWRWPARHRLSPPIAVQIVALLLGGIIVAQLVTLALTLLLPPTPPPRHSLADIAAGLRGAPVATQGAKPLLRAADDQPPSLDSPGWFVSEAAHADLARMLNADPDDVRLLFYAPLPFAGSPTRALTNPEGQKPPSPRLGLGLGLLDGLRSAIAPPAAAQTPPASATGMVLPPPGFPARPDGSGAPDFRGGMMTPPPGARPGGMVILRPGSGGGPPPVWASRFPQAQAPRGALQAGQRPALMSAPGDRVVSRPAMVMPLPGLNRAAGDMSAAPAVGRLSGPIGPMRASAGGFGGGDGLERGFVYRSTAIISPTTTGAKPIQGFHPVTRETRSDTVATPAPLTVRAAPTPEPAITRAPVLAAAAAVKAAIPSADPGRRIAAPSARGLFGLSQAPYIEGDFIAAYRVAPDRWVTLRTQPEAFPSAWQKRMMLWFGISFAIVAPLGWIFARRLAAPLGDFARAAERLGREPTAEVMALEGPAEVGQAARAFNQMQARLRRYVEDRNGMIGAISHDLRTPLARLRFRIERASPGLRREMARDLDQMEAMITSVLTFMRENAEAGDRRRVDLRSIIECAVDDAEVVGADVSLEPGGPAEVEVDVLSVQRVFANLIDNAVKYGDQAQVRLFRDRNEIVAEVSDRGPGLADTELDRVFLPFYRSAEARNSTRQGVGLGLSTSRSTIRAHGGDIRLRRGQTGLVAEVRLPMARVAS